MASRRPNTNLQEYFMFTYNHAQNTVDTTIKLFTAQRAMRFDKIEYVNVTGLAAHATVFETISLLKDATVMASWCTDSNDATGNINGGATEGTIAADTIVNLTKHATAATLVCAAGAVISLKLDDTGSATLPAGRLIVHGTYV